MYCIRWLWGCFGSLVILRPHILILWSSYGDRLHGNKQLGLSCVKLSRNCLGRGWWRRRRRRWWLWSRRRRDHWNRGGRRTSWTSKAGKGTKEKLNIFGRRSLNFGPSIDFNMFSFRFITWSSFNYPFHPQRVQVLMWTTFMDFQ